MRTAVSPSPLRGRCGDPLFHQFEKLEPYAEGATVLKLISGCPSSRAPGSAGCRPLAWPAASSISGTAATFLIPLSASRFNALRDGRAERAR